MSSAYQVKEQANNSANGRWSKKEHSKFLFGNICFYLGLELFGRNWKKIEEFVGTRTGSQVRSHAQKHFLRDTKDC